MTVIFSYFALILCLLYATLRLASQHGLRDLKILPLQSRPPYPFNTALIHIQGWL